MLAGKGLSYIEGGELCPVGVECLVVELDKLLCVGMSGFGSCKVFDRSHTRDTLEV